MINGINISALSEFSHEVIDSPEEAIAKYGVKLDWQSGTKSKVSTKTMELGNHRSIRNFEMAIDEPKSLLGLNTAANPQEYLLAGLAGCMSVVFMAGAALMKIKIESLQIDVDGELDLTGFLHSNSDRSPGLTQIDYTINVRGDGTEAQYLQLIEKITKHSPNYATIANPVKLVPHLIMAD